MTVAGIHVALYMPYSSAKNGNCPQCGGDHHMLVTNSARRLYLNFMHTITSHCVWLC